MAPPPEWESILRNAKSSLAPCLLLTLVAVLPVVGGESGPEHTGLTVELLNDVIERADLRQTNPQDVSAAVCPSTTANGIRQLDAEYGVEVKEYYKDGIIAQTGDLTLVYTVNMVTTLSNTVLFILFRPRTNYCSASIRLNTL